MKRSLLMAGAAALGVGLAAPVAFGQIVAPAPQSPTPAGSAPGTTRTGTAAPAPPVALPGVRTVMVFPFENNTSAGGRPLGEALAEAVRKGLDASRIYSAVLFSPDSLMVQRLREEQPNVAEVIRTVIDPTKGTVDPARAMAIASRTGMQSLMLGSIEDYKYDKAANKVEIVATAQILDSVTGEPLKTAGVTGTASGAAGADESVVAQAAATDVANRILGGLAVPPPPALTNEKQRHPRHRAETQEQQGSRRKFPGWIPAGLLLGIIAASVR